MSKTTYGTRKPILMNPKQYVPDAGGFFSREVYGAPDVIRLMEHEFEAADEDFERLLDCSAIPRRDRIRGLKKLLRIVKEIRCGMGYLNCQIALREDALRAGQEEGADSETLESISAELDNLRGCLADAARALREESIEITDLAGRLEEPSQKMVILKKYIDLKSWKEIALDMDMSERSVQKLHGRALVRLDEIMQEEYSAK